jgi:hypothetical protein
MPEAASRNSLKDHWGSSANCGVDRARRGRGTTRLDHAAMRCAVRGEIRAWPLFPIAHDPAVAALRSRVLVSQEHDQQRQLQCEHAQQESRDRPVLGVLGGVHEGDYTAAVNRRLQEGRPIARRPESDPVASAPPDQSPEARALIYQQVERPLQGFSTVSCLNSSLESLAQVLHVPRRALPPSGLRGRARERTLQVRQSTRWRRRQPASRCHKAAVQRTHHSSNSEPLVVIRLAPRIPRRSLWHVRTACHPARRCALRT